jgi:hypothetical protein
LKLKEDIIAEYQTHLHELVRDKELEFDFMHSEGVVAGSRGRDRVGNHRGALEVSEKRQINRMNWKLQNRKVNA